MKNSKGPRLRSHGDESEKKNENNNVDLIRIPKTTRLLIPGIFGKFKAVDDCRTPQWMQRLWESRSPIYKVCQ